MENSNTLKMTGPSLALPVDVLRQWFNRISPWLLTPPLRVRLLTGQDGVELWEANERLVSRSSGGGRAPAFDAIELPQSMWLHRKLTLPLVAASNLERAAALDVDAASPFDPADTVWGFAARDVESRKIEVEIALASRSQVEAYLKAATARLTNHKPLEVWVKPGETRAIVLRGLPRSSG